MTWRRSCWRLLRQRRRQPRSPKMMRKRSMSTSQRMRMRMTRMRMTRMRMTRMRMTMTRLLTGLALLAGPVKHCL
ncbi:hypothetical protein FR483_n306L [Paramecium bursaria Chlorella virus FR483]|uniref:Uncharacterized protein n306L n=1 Tax=Paramecium bursaria Chlorella virus FR483 TaxID=399781 RepID=A7J710_PBCVF|nr:hypothetical protein FR483_n306L [Paramecium bursaria Chlorella virus FR483]ABT15591.1 hypothetical protein FR483_n306L [Paramecium bursaria Chlorella virus FR483]